MKWLTLEYIKKHSRIDYDIEDDLLELYGNAAEDVVLNILNRSYQDLVSYYGAVPTPIVQASLLLVDVSYQNRSAVTPQNLYLVPYTFDILIKPFMSLAGSSVNKDTQTVTLGSETKIAFSAELPDGITMESIPFTVTVYNADKKDVAVTTDKNECIRVNDNEYVVLVDTILLGVGIYMLSVCVQIPDSDFPSSYRKEIIKINPNVQCIG